MEGTQTEPPASPAPVKKKTKDRIIVLDKTFNLTPELPLNLVYWNRCETRVDDEDIVTNSQLLEFYREEFMHHEDLDGSVAQVSDQAPYFRGKPMFRDPKQEKFVSSAEERILKNNVWPDGMKKYHIEGHIILGSVDDSTIFFNSKFETGNLRQVFKAVPKSNNTPAQKIPESPRKQQESPLKIREEPNNLSIPDQQTDIKNKPIQEYNLYLQDDTNSDNSLTQWFYFSCLNVKKGTILKMNMMNLMKDDSLYSMGMKPFVYSRKRHYQGDGTQWHREGFNIDYYYNDKTIRTSGKTLDMAFDPRYVDNQKDKFKKMSTLSFSYEFKYDNDVVFFTHFAPYSYSDVFRYLCKLESNQSLKEFMRIDYICNTLGKVPMYGLTITNNIETEYISQEEEIELFRKFEYQDYDVRPKKKKIRLPGLPGHDEPDNVEKKLVEIAHEKMFIKPKEEKTARKEKKVQQEDVNNLHSSQQPEEEIRQPRYKKFIFLSSRVHPGETNSQYMIQGCIEFILSDDPIAVELRNRFIFKIIPILNPDGVIHGNYRASLMGVDLNRRWKNPSKFLHPTIYYAKSLIRFFHTLGQQPDSETGGVVFSCDMHGHSRNMNIFMYACKNLADEQISRYPNQVIWNIPENVIHFCPIFSTKDCKMALEKDKEATARIVLYKEFGITNSYTLEATFFGSEHFKKPRPYWIKAVEDSEKVNQRYDISDQRSDIHITPLDLLYVGHDFLRGIFFAQSKKTLSYHWFDEPKKYEAIKLKEQQILMMLQKQLEEIQAKEKERLRLLAIEEKQRKIREKKERKAAEKAAMIAAQQRNGSLEKVIEETDETVKKKKKKKKQKDFGGWDGDQHPGMTQIVDPAAGTAGTTNTDMDRKIKKKKKGEETIVVKIKKLKKGDLPTISSNKKPVQLIESRYMNVPQNKMNITNGGQNQPQGQFGLGDNLMLQYNKYAQKQNNNEQQVMTFDDRGNNNNKMIELVEQILQDDIESYQQNALFPQYAMRNKKVVLTQQSQQQIQANNQNKNSSKLKQVSQLMNEMVKNRNIDESKGVGVINIKNINFSNNTLSQEISQFVTTPKKEEQYSDNPNGGLTVSLKIRNSSLQPYKNKVQDGPMIIGKSKPVVASMKIEEQSRSSNMNSHTQLGTKQGLSDTFQRRKASVQPYSNGDTEEYDRYKKFVLYERQKYQQNQFVKQETKEVDSSLKKYEKYNINNDSSEEEPTEEIPNPIDEHQALLNLNEYSSNFQLDQQIHHDANNQDPNNKQLFRPYILKQQHGNLGSSVSSQKLHGGRIFSPPKSLFPTITTDTILAKVLSSRDQVSEVTMANQQKANRSYQNTFHGNTLVQGITRQGNQSQNNTIYQQFQTIKGQQNRQSPDLRLPEIKSSHQLQNSPMTTIKGQYQMKGSPLKIRSSQNADNMPAYDVRSPKYGGAYQQKQSHEFQQIQIKQGSNSKY